MTQKNKVGLTVFSQKGRKNLSEHLSSFCQLKKYQCQADCWIGFGINVLDSTRIVHEYFFYDVKWKRDKQMDQTVKWALKMGFIHSKPNCKW